MNEEMINTTEETVDDIDVIENLRRTTVPREDYDAMAAKYNKAINALARGEYTKPAAEQQYTSSEDLRKKFLDTTAKTNLDYWQNTLDLRDALMREGKADPFLPYHPTSTVDMEAAAAKAEKVANVVRECIAEAEGDSARFTLELQRRTIDTNIPKKRR